MPIEQQSAFDALKSLSIPGAETTLFIVHRKLQGRAARYFLSKVDIEDRLRIQLQAIARDAIASVTELDDYTFLSDDQDGRALTLPVTETDFAIIRDFLESTPEIARATDIDDLLGAWGYILRITGASSHLYGFRKLTRFWGTKKVRGVINLIFDDEVLIDVSDKPVFKIDAKLDFLSYGHTLFVLDKGQFESALNYRVAMEEHRDEVVAEFSGMNIFTDVAAIRDVIGNNIRMLRKVATVHQRGYYRDSLFMEQLRHLNNEEGWGLDILSDGKIVVTPDKVSLILTLLGNDRLASRINAEVFDVTVKRKVG